jgi:hypothetical protein
VAINKMVLSMVVPFYRCQVSVFRCQDYEHDDVRNNHILYAVICLLTPET